MFRRRGERGCSKIVPFPVCRPKIATVALIPNRRNAKKPARKSNHHKAVSGEGLGTPLPLRLNSRSRGHSHVPPVIVPNGMPSFH